MASNRIFNVNGPLDKDGHELLKAALELSIAQSGCKKVEGYRLDPKLGLVLYWADHPDATKFPFTLSGASLLSFVLDYFNSRPLCEATGWDKNADHDGDNGPGWRVYCEDWGHIGGHWQAFLAIKPAFMWYGK